MPDDPDPWSNLSASPHDGETAEIDRLQETLGEISRGAMEVRQLITRFESCHFKCARHLHRILRSIAALEPAVDPEQIGAAHPRQGSSAWEGDPSGRSRTGQEYLTAMRLWLGEVVVESEQEAIGDLLVRICDLLGTPNPGKEKLVRRLMDRLLWRFEERAEGWEQETELEEQVDRTDICHSSFPRNLELVLSGIGKGEPERDFRGCGSVSDGTVAELDSWYGEMCAWLAGDDGPLAGSPMKRTPTRVWLATCLAKTIKEQCGLEGALPALASRTGESLE